MKFANKKTGFTLLELTVVISVLLGLIGLLVIGIQAYLRSVEKTTCLLNMSNIAKEIQGQNLLDGTLPSNIIRRSSITSPGLRSANINGATLTSYNGVVCPSQRRLEKSNITDQYPFSETLSLKARVETDYFVIFRTATNPDPPLSGGINFSIRNKNRVSVICLASVEGEGNDTFGEPHRLRKTVQY